MRTVTYSCVVTALAVHLAVATAQTPPPSDSAKIADAGRAAPAELTAKASILDWPAVDGAEFRVIRQGSSGWICLPDPPGDRNDEPMCLDDEWMGFMKAFKSGTPPTTKGVGLAYMLGGSWAVSNTEPRARAPSATNQWHDGGSHLMLLVPDPTSLGKFPTTPSPKGGPYVMWAGTPYAHLMIPLPDVPGTKH